MTHKKTILLFHKKYEYADGEIVEVKRHHKHLGGRELPCEFVNIERLIEQFGREVAHLRRKMT